MHIIGIDIGTTKIAAVLVDMSTGGIHVLAHAPTPTLTPGFDGEHIQDAAQIITLVRRMIDDCLAGLDSQSVAAIGISGQMHGMAYLDSEGQAISPLYTWQDRRGEAYSEPPALRAGYGHATHAYNASHGLVPASAKGYATVADAVCAALCGLRDPILHASSAASMGCFDIDKNRFWGRAKDYPYEIESAYRIAGSYRGIPVAIGIGDNQASFLGSGACRGELLINVGTGSQVSMLSDHAVGNEAVETRPGFDGCYLLVGAALCGGRAYALLHRFFCDVVQMATGKRPDSLYEAMAAYQTDAKDASLRFSNLFCGTRQDPSCRASISGIGQNNFTPEQFCIGVLEGMVGELAELYGAIGLSADGLVGAGNALRKNPLLRRLCEKRFGSSLYLPHYTEEAAVGAALYAAICAGILPDARAAAAFIRQNDGTQTPK